MENDMRMILSRKDLEKINEVLKKFPDVQNFRLEEEGGNGIGTVITMAFDHESNGVDGIFSVEISGVEDW